VLHLLTLSLVGHRPVHPEQLEVDMKVSILGQQETYCSDDWIISGPNGFSHVHELPLRFVKPGVVLADPHPYAGPGRRVLVGYEDGQARLTTVDRIIPRLAHDLTGLDIDEFTLRFKQQRPHNDPSRSDSDVHSDVLKRDMIVEVEVRAASGAMPNGQKRLVSKILDDSFKTLQLYNYIEIAFIQTKHPQPILISKDLIQPISGQVPTTELQSEAKYLDETIAPRSRC